MKVIEALLARRSVSPRLMHDPGPTADELQTMLRTGARAADHGRLRPWQFVVVQGDARAKLGEVFAQARHLRDPAATDADLAKERSKPLRAPVLIVVAARIRHDRDAIRPVDQLLAAGAAAQNMLLAAYAMGYGAIWLTGSNGHDPRVKLALGLQPEDEFVGFLYIGSVDSLASMPPAEVDLDGLVQHWEAPITPA